MPAAWDRRRILIWGKTRPEISQTYQEIVCTGGVLGDSKRFVRLYPIPLRLLGSDNRFGKYQWITADIQRASDRDPRPESFRIRPDSIDLQEAIPTSRGSWDKRAEWIVHDGNVFESVEELQARREEDHTSLGLVKPAEIHGIRAEEVPQADRLAYWGRYEAATRQLELPFEREGHETHKPLGPADYRFKVEFSCDDPACSRHHVMSVLDWEVDALYHRQRARGRAEAEAAEDVVRKLEDTVFASSRDTRFFLGNMARWQHVYTIVGLWYPKKSVSLGSQQQLPFD